MKTSISLILTFIISTVGTAAWAGSDNITLEAVAEIEMEVANDDGTKDVKRVPATKVIPGTEVIYTISYANVGNESANNIVITDPIPEHMLYTRGTARGNDTAITYSVDGGNTFDSSSKLKVQSDDGSVRPAKSADYTHIRWALNKTLRPEHVGQVEFRARLK